MPHGDRRPGAGTKKPGKLSPCLVAGSVTPLLYEVTNLPWAIEAAFRTAKHLFANPPDLRPALRTAAKAGRSCRAARGAAPP